MTPNTIDWSKEASLDPKLEYQALVRSLKYSQGFGLLFVSCSPATAERLITQVKKDLSAESIAERQANGFSANQKLLLEVLRLEEPISNLYNIVAALPHVNEIDVLFIQGIEKSLTEYIKPGYQGEGDYYNLDTIPRILGHLNLQRERFRDDFNICFVFLVPPYALKYFIRRAPDFFDWGSGVVEMPMDKTLANREAQAIERSTTKLMLQQLIRTIPEAELNNTLLELQELLEEPHLSGEARANILTKQASIFLVLGQKEVASSCLDEVRQLNPDHASAQIIQQLLKGKPDFLRTLVPMLEQLMEILPENKVNLLARGTLSTFLDQHEEAIESFDQALKVKPDYDQAWYSRGIALAKLGRYEEAIESFDQALKVKPDYDQAWYIRGIALALLGRYEEAIESFDQALKVKPDYDQAWDNRGVALYELGRYEEAIASYDEALKVKPDYDQAWKNRGYALYELGRYEETIASYDQALKVKPDDYQAWNNRGVALYELGRYEEAIASYDEALKFKPDNPNTFYNKACCYALQGDGKAAISHLTHAIALDPDQYRELAKTDSDFDSIRDQKAFQALLSSHTDEAEVTK